MSKFLKYFPSFKDKERWEAIWLFVNQKKNLEYMQQKERYELQNFDKMNPSERFRELSTRQLNLQTLNSISLDLINLPLKLKEVANIIVHLGKK